MDAFNHLSVFLSIILGLAVTQVLTGFRGWLLARKRVKNYWPVLAWCILLLLIYAQSWWALFGLREHSGWNFSGFAIVLLQMILLYMLAGAVLPDFAGEKTIDLREHYFTHHVWLFTLALAATLVSVSKDFVLDRRFTNPTNLIFHLIFAALAISGIFLKREWFHKFVVVFMFAIFLVYIFELFGRLA